MRKQRRKRFVEIYFILYLAALILLIPDKRHEENRAAQLITSLLQSSFSIQPERTTMLCRMVQNAEGTRILSFDSLNTIYHSGNVRDVQYDFAIEDQSYKQSMHLVSGGQTTNSLFRLTGKVEEGNIKFAWQPPLGERSSRLFRVKVKASALPLLPATLPQEQRTYFEQLIGSGFRLQAETQFTVALLYDGDSPSIAMVDPNNTEERNRLDSLIAVIRSIAGAGTSSTPAPGEFFLQPSFENINTIAYQDWENRITVFGADPQRDLLGAPNVTGGQASVKVEGNQLVIRGTAPPSSGTMYQVSVQRASDRKEVSVIFRVTGQSLGTPALAQRMYPGIQYTINPNLPFISGTPATASLRDEQSNIRAISQQGESFTFTPSVNDTGKTLIFERSLNGKKIGQSIVVTVTPFPPPEILDAAQLSGGNIRIRTRAYGLEGDNMARVRLEATGLQGKVQEMFGDYSYDKQYNVHLQVFLLAPQSNSVNIKAVNGYKKSSQIREIRPKE